MLSNQDHFLEAYVQREWAQICWRQGQPADAQQAFQRAIDLFEQLGSLDERDQTVVRQQALTGSCSTRSFR